MQHLYTNYSRLQIEHHIEYVEENLPTPTSAKHLTASLERRRAQIRRAFTTVNHQEGADKNTTVSRFGDSLQSSAPQEHREPETTAPSSSGDADEDRSGHSEIV